MKICFLSSLYYEKKLGGGVFTYLNLVPEAMAELGHEVTIVTAGKTGVTVEAEVQVVSISPVEIYKTPIQIISRSYLYKRLIYLVFATKYIMTHNFDVVVSSDGGFEHLLLVFLRKCPVITHMHGRTADTKRLSFSWLFTFLENVAIKRSTGVIFPTESYKQYAIKEHRLRLQKVKVLPYPLYINSPLQKKVKTKKKMVLVVGLLSHRKGIDLLVKIAKGLMNKKDINITLVGANLENISTSNFPPNLSYLGYKDHKKLSLLYEECDLLLSTSRFETFGIAVAEAMSFGKPVVVNDSVGTKDFVINGVNGYIFKKDDVADAISKINLLVQNSYLRKQLGKSAQNTTNRFALNKVTNDTISFYKKVINSYEKK